MTRFVEWPNGTWRWVRTLCMLTLLVGLLFLSWKSDYDKHYAYGNTAMKHIVRVVMREPHHYALFIQKPGKTSVDVVDMELPGNRWVEIEADLATSNSMWAYVTFKRNWYGGVTYQHVVIHVHSWEEIDVAG